MGKAELFFCVSYDTLPDDEFVAFQSPARGKVVARGMVAIMRREGVAGRVVLRSGGSDGPVLFEGSAP